MIELNYKKIIVICSFVLNAILLWLLFGRTDNEDALRDELMKSQGRVEMLEKKQIELQQIADSLALIDDSLATELAKKPEERIVIINQKDEQIRNIVALSIDSNLQFFAKRVSAVNIDR